MPLPNDARKVRGAIERSINVDSLQEHHELGCSVTNECGVSHCNRGNSAGDREVCEPRAGLSTTSIRSPKLYVDGTTWSFGKARAR